jgi:hypothetical protein
VHKEANFIPHAAAVIFSLKYLAFFNPAAAPAERVLRNQDTRLCKFILLNTAGKVWLRGFKAFFSFYCKLICTAVCMFRPGVRIT